MEQTDFSDVRRAPKGRESMFVPEVQLVRALKRPVEEKKIAKKFTVDEFENDAGKLIPTLPVDSLNRMKAAIQRIKHFEDLDQKILVIASYLYISLPGGIQYEDRGNTLTPEKLNSEFINQLIHNYLILNEIGEDISIKVKADILAYYSMFFG